MSVPAASIDGRKFRRIETASPAVLEAAVPDALAAVTSASGAATVATAAAEATAPTAATTVATEATEQHIDLVAFGRQLPWLFMRTGVVQDFVALSDGEFGL